MRILRASLSIRPLILGLLALGAISCGGGRVTQAPQPSPPAPMAISLPGGVGLELVGILANPGGFLMGSPSAEAGRYSDEGPQQAVTLRQSYYMGKLEVTQAQWLAVMGSNPSWFKGDLALPVESVSWNDITRPATGFLDRLNALTIATRPAGMAFRLPTGAEWEYAARAGTATRYSWGEDPVGAAIGNHAWYSANADGGSGRMTHRAGGKLPNPWGLYDMAGNVAEWCQDWYGSYSSLPLTDPTGPTGGKHKLLMGGSWEYDANGCRSAYRDALGPDSRVNAVGFRVVLTP